MLPVGCGKYQVKIPERNLIQDLEGGPVLELDIHKHQVRLRVIDQLYGCGNLRRRANHRCFAGRSTVEHEYKRFA